MPNSKNDFKWHPQKDACRFIHQELNYAIGKNSFLQKFQKELFEKTSTHLFDWVDHIELGSSPEYLTRLDELGFEQEIAAPSYRVFYHPAAKLPLVVMKDNPDPFITVAIGVESITDFLMMQGISSWIEGDFLSGYRRASISKQEGVFVTAIERRGCLSMEPVVHQNGDIITILAAYEKWQTRPRTFFDPDTEAEGIVQAMSIAEELVEAVGDAMSAHIVCDVERRFWQAKNRAGQLQKGRQDFLGLGWANHDHHTFRSSRSHFRDLVRLFEILGFSCRERFYAGTEAGWGAQVMEHKKAGLVLFLDVDLTPDEINIDFSHTKLDEKTELGTIGLWCALHGESILQAGMHHLEAQFSFDALCKDLKHEGVEMMDPFTNLGYLTQAFTKGEMWPVNEMRLIRLLEKGIITSCQYESFQQKGALGSHLENLERKDGYKGFHQKSVSDIIRRVDPRK